jgi:sarcosine oxidase subunit gamma
MAKARLWQAIGEGFKVSQIAGLRLLQIQLSGGDFHSCATAIGIELPSEPNVITGSTPRAMWLAPGEWLIAHFGEIQPDEWDLRLQPQNILYILNDVSDGYAVFDISGPAARDLIAHGCSLDLHPSVFGADRCARTVFADSPVLISTGSTPSIFRVFADPGLEWFLRDWFEQHTHTPLGSLP